MHERIVTTIQKPDRNAFNGLDPLDDKILIKSVASGDRDSMSRFYETYYPRAYRFMLLRTGNHHDSEDRAQEVMVRVISSINKYNSDKGSFSSWLNTILRNDLVDLKRHETRTAKRIVQGISPENLSDSDSLALRSSSLGGIDEALEGEDNRNKLGDSIERLNPSQREVILLRFWADMTFEEIANFLGEPLGTVKTRGRLALSHLRNFIDSRDRVVDEDSEVLEAKKLPREILKEVLTPREESVIALRAGLDDDVERTFREIGEKLHITRQGAKNAEKKAMKKLMSQDVLNRLEEIRLENLRLGFIR